VVEPNKDYWHGCQVTDYERRQYLIIPRKDECLDTIVDFCPFGEDDEIHVVDLGAGQGALSKRVLARFKRAYVTLFDASDEMVAVAKEQLAEYEGRYSVVIGDFSDPDWYEPISRPIHAIISNQALQYVRLECRTKFFQSVYSLLETPGYFANGGAFNTACRLIQECGEYKALELTQKKLLELEGKQVSIEHLREKRKEGQAKAGVNRMLFEDQVAFLKNAGFEQAEVVWRYLLRGVVVAYKGAEAF
jgi:hypothetical protein